MNDYKMLDYEQWLDWLDNNAKDYDVYDCGNTKDIVVYTVGYHHVVLEFDADSGELISISVK